MKLEPLQLLRDMIAIPSVNPMRPDCTEAVESDLVAYIENILCRERIDCERQNVSKGRDNLIAIVQSGGEQQGKNGLMLNSHLDTVPVANMSINPFDPQLKDGRVYGRGACDAKGSLAAMMTTLVSYAKRPERPVPLVFAAMVDEEFSFSGSWKFIERDWPVRACVVGEPTKLKTIIAHKGIARWRLRVKGISAHGAMPSLGHSAIYDAARVALALEEYAKELFERTPHPLLGPPTLNVGRIGGGSSVNIVPDSCELEIERRLLPGEDGVRVLQECETWVRERVGAEVRFEFEKPYLVDPALETSDESQVVRSVANAHQAEFGEDSSLEGAHYGTDGSKLARVGIETVVCGPGDIAQAHTRDEFIEIEQLERAVRLYDRLISNWGTMQ
jgi:acetylornithine deacetylase ArgE